MGSAHEVARHFRNRLGTICGTLREELAERKRLMELYVPADTRAVNERATEALRNSGIAESALKVKNRRLNLRCSITTESRLVQVRSWRRVHW